MVDNTTSIYCAHLFILGVLGIYYYKKVCLQIKSKKENTKKNMEYTEIKREINNLKERINTLEEEQYIM